jgi:hypothetical protein
MSFGAEKWKQLFNNMPDSSSYVECEQGAKFRDSAANTFRRNRFTGDRVTIDNNKYEDLYLEQAAMRKKQCRTIFFRLDGKEFWTTMSGPPR